MKRVISMCAVLVALLAGSSASALTIYDIQYSTGPDYNSPYLGQTVDVAGGVIVKIFAGGSTKITIQDPTLGDAWAGVQVVFSDPSQADGLLAGDRIDLSGVRVDEYRGNTQLAFLTTSTLIVRSSGNHVEPLVVSVADIPLPTDADRSEPFEFMLLRVVGVTVGAMDLGKNADNYELGNSEGVCWASDYANSDLPPGSDYFVQAGQVFQSVTGYLEQYKRPDQGWDYYQLLPRDAGDYEVFVPVPTETSTWGGVKGMFR